MEQASAKAAALKQRRLDGLRLTFKDMVIVCFGLRAFAHSQSQQFLMAWDALHASRQDSTMQKLTGKEYRWKKGASGRLSNIGTKARTAPTLENQLAHAGRRAAIRRLSIPDGSQQQFIRRKYLITALGNKMWYYWNINMLVQQTACQQLRQAVMFVAFS